MRISFHTKFLVSLLALVTVSLASMGFVLLRDADQRLDEFIFLQAKSQARTLAESSEDLLLVNDYPMLENLVNVAVSENHYAFAAIVSPQGIVYSHSDYDLIGSRLTTPKQNSIITISETHIDERPVKEIIYPIGLGNNHLANAHIAYYMDTQLSLANETVTWLVEILALTLLVIAIGSLLITKHFTKPIVILTHEVNDILTDFTLNLDEQILHRTDEVGDLARAFKSMSDQLVDRLAELEYQIKERDNARAANETKSAFLANVSHELRTPLNAIIGYSELLLDVAVDEGDNESQKDLEKICGSARHLNSIIDDMLDLSKIEAGKFELVPTVVDMNQFIEEIKTSVTPLVEKNNNKLVCESYVISEHAYADSLRLKQVVLNLVSNAAKFTEQGTITITVTPLDDFIAIAVKDTGIGMSVEQVAKVFEAFTQADKETTIKYGGTGLGLTISRNLCHMMGGDISVESQQGNGSTFTATIPTAYSVLKAANDFH